MAKVKCLYCKQYFDRDKEPFVKVKNRYAHVNCAKNYEALLTQEEREALVLEDYIEKLFNQPFVPPRIQAQIKTYLAPPYNYTYKGILRALRYWYEVKKSDISKARGGIGIVPSIYQDANNYYYSIWLANEKNKVVQKVETEVEEIHIVPPERQEKKRKLFTFLDEEDELNGK